MHLKFEILRYGHIVGGFRISLFLQWCLVDVVIVCSSGMFSMSCDPIQISWTATPKTNQSMASAAKKTNFRNKCLRWKWTCSMKLTYCWWKTSCTTWDVSNPVNSGINYQPQLVSRISEPSTVGWKQKTTYRPWLGSESSGGVSPFWRICLSNWTPPKVRGWRYNKIFETTLKIQKTLQLGVTFSIVYCGVVFRNETANSRAILSKVLANLEKTHEQKCIFWRTKGSESFRLPAADGWITGRWTIWLGGFVRFRPSTVSKDSLTHDNSGRNPPPIQSILVDYTFDHEQCNPHRWWSQYD